MSDKTIRVMVDNQQPVVRGARSQVEEFIASRTRHVVDVGVDTLRTQIENTLGTFLELLNGLHLDEDRFHVESISLTLSVNAEGKISLLSVGSGSIGSHAGLTFTLQRTSG